MTSDAHLPQLLRLRASIVGSDPEIWREIEVGDWLTLGHLHEVLQVAFGWQQSHLHDFTDQDPWEQRHGIPRIGAEPRSWTDQWSIAEQDLAAQDEADAALAEVFDRGGPLWYTYDFGDGWVHRIDLVGRRPAAPTDVTVALLGGARRAPFEDSGGIGGYAEKLAIMADPRHPEHDDIIGWARFVAGPWGSLDPDDAGLDRARNELALLIAAPQADLSGLVDPARGIEAGVPIVELAANLPVPYRVNLRGHLRATGVLHPVALSDEGAAALVRPYRWLLDRVGDDGLSLTAAGWMRPVDVAAAVDELGWRVYGKGNREQNTREVARMRDSATGLRLIRKLKGQLVIPARMRGLAGDPQALCAQIAHMLLRQRMDEAQRIASTVFVLGIADGTITTEEDATRAVLGVVNGFGYVDGEGRPLNGRWFYALTEPARQVLTTMGLWPDYGLRGEAPTAALRALARMALR